MSQPPTEISKAAARQFKPYPAYKPSGVEWLGDVPEHWGVKRLKYSSSINDEALPESTSPNYELAYVDIGNVDATSGIGKIEVMFFEGAPSRARRIVRDGDTIVSTVRTYLRAIVPIQIPLANLIVSTGFAVVRPRTVAPRFLSYALRESGFVDTIVARSVGVSYPAVNASEIGTIPIPLPSEIEQHDIAEFLDGKTAEVDALVAKKQALIENLKERRSALIARTVTRGLPPEAARSAGFDPSPKLKPSGIEWLGDVPVHWEIKPIFRLASEIQTGPFGSQLHESDYVDGGIPLINPAHIVGGRIVPDNQSTVDEKTASRLSRHQLRTGDIIMGRRGEIGRCSVVTATEEGWLCGTGSLVIRLKDSDANFFATLIGSAGFAGLLELNAVGTTMLNLSPSIVGRMQVPVPPMQEQHAISIFLVRQANYIDSMVTKVDEVIERLQEYRAALIAAAVTGKVDVRGTVA